MTLYHNIMFASHSSGLLPNIKVVSDMHDEQETDALQSVNLRILCRLWQKCGKIGFFLELKHFDSDVIKSSMRFPWLS